VTAQLLILICQITFIKDKSVASSTYLRLMTVALLIFHSKKETYKFNLCSKGFGAMSRSEIR
jgi:hypothetical protein